MKYTIESTVDGCTETIEFKNGEKFVAKTQKTCFGCEGITPCLANQLEEAGYCEEIVEKVDELYDGIAAYDFMELAELDY